MAMVHSHTLVILNICPYSLCQHAIGDKIIQGSLGGRVRTKICRLEESASLEPYAIPERQTMAAKLITK